MPQVSIIFAAIAAAIHVLFFAMESIFFMNPKVYKGFGVRSNEDAELLKVSMFNQGFYNLFLAIGIFEGIYLLRDYTLAGKSLILFCCASMVAAAVVLLFSKKGMMRGVLLQGLCPLIAIVCYLCIH